MVFQPIRRGAWFAYPLSVLSALVGLVLLYFASAVVGSLLPVNTGSVQPQQGVTIFIETNGVHTWIVVPAVTAEMDWRRLAPVRDIRDARYGGSHIAIGYGNREFYLNTPAWKDLTVGRAVGAAFGNGPSLMHVYHEHQPVAGPLYRPIVVSRDQYRKLASFIANSFQRDAAGGTIPLRGRGYGPSDVFYEARGGYNAFYTCNEWTGSALRHAGVRVGAWTPLAQSITWRF